MSSRKTAGHLVLLSLGMLFAAIGSVGCGGGSDGGTGGSGSGGRGTGGSGSGGSGSGGSGSGGSGTGGSATGGSGSGGNSTGGSGTGGSASGGSGTGGAASGGAVGGATATGGAGGRGGSAGGAGGGATGGRGGSTGGAGGATGGRGGGTAGAGGGSASATAMIALLTPGTITGTAAFVQVTNGVQVTINLANCPQGVHGIHIHAGTGCAMATQGDHWGGTGTAQMPTRGEGIGAGMGQITCNAQMTATLVYTRTNGDAATRWTIGDGSGTDIIGHPIVVHGLTNTDRHGCGVIQAN